MDDQRQGINHFAVDHNIHSDQFAAAVVEVLVVERCVPLGDRFELVVKIKHDFVQRQFIDDHHPGGGQILDLALDASLFFTKSQYSADIFVGHMDVGQDERFLDKINMLLLRQLVGAFDGDHLAVGLVYTIDDRRCGGDQVQVKLPLQTLLDDLHVQ